MVDLKAIFGQKEPHYLKNLEYFFKLIEDQLNYGAVKYKANEAGKETTDVLFDKFGKSYLFGTICKYVHRLKTVKRERDALKIASFLFIMWIKRGFWVVKDGINDPVLNSNIELKLNNLDKFKTEVYLNFDKVYRNMKTSRIKQSDLLNAIEQFLLDSNNQIKFCDVPETKIIDSFILIIIYWFEAFDSKGADTDTWNETKGK